MQFCNRPVSLQLTSMIKRKEFPNKGESHKIPRAIMIRRLYDSPFPKLNPQSTYFIKITFHSIFRAICRPIVSEVMPFLRYHHTEEKKSKMAIDSNVEKRETKIRKFKLRNIVRLVLYSRAGQTSKREKFSNYSNSTFF